MEPEKTINILINMQNIINENHDKSILVLNAQSKIIFANNKFLETTGYCLHEIKGKSPLNIGLGDNSSDEFLSLIDSTSKGKTFSGVFKNIKKNGEIYYTETSVIPIYENAQRISHYIALSKIRLK